MKTLILISAMIAAISLCSCSKDPVANAGGTSTLDTIAVSVTATSVYSHSGSFGNTAIVTTGTFPTISNLVANADVSYDVYDSTVFKYRKVSAGVALPGNRTDTIAAYLIKPVISNVIVDTARYSSTSVPGYYLNLSY